MNINLFLILIAKVAIKVGIIPKMKGKTKEAKRLIKPLSINLNPLFLYIEQYEVIKYQLNPKKIKPTKKYIITIFLYFCNNFKLLTSRADFSFSNSIDSFRPLFFLFFIFLFVLK